MDVSVAVPLRAGEPTAGIHFSAMSGKSCAICMGVDALPEAGIHGFNPRP